MAQLASFCVVYARIELREHLFPPNCPIPTSSPSLVYPASLQLSNSNSLTVAVVESNRFIDTLIFVTTNMGSSKKTPAAKKDQLAAVHSASKAIKTAQALQTAKVTKAPGSAAKASGSAPIAPRPAPIDTGYTHHLPTKEQIAGNGRKAGRNLILWQRKFTESRVPSAQLTP